jgi:hypothetical protein
MSRTVSVAETTFFGTYIPVDTKNEAGSGFKIIFDDQNMKPLVEAFQNAPLSLALRESLWVELGRFIGSDGITDCSDVSATEAGDWRVSGRIGRAGELFVAALQALAVAGESEGHKIPPMARGLHQIGLS